MASIFKKTITLFVFSSITFLFASNENSYYCNNPYGSTTIITKETRDQWVENFNQPKQADIPPHPISSPSSSMGLSHSSIPHLSSPQASLSSLSKEDAETSQSKKIMDTINGILSYSAANWKNDAFLNLHQILSAAILEGKLTIEEFMLIPPEKCIALSLPLIIGIPYSLDFLSNYSNQIKLIEHLTQKGRHALYSLDLNLNIQLLINQIAERYYLISTNIECLLISKISIANCYRLLRKNTLAFEKGYEALQFSVQHNLNNKIGTILFGILTSFYHHEKNNQVSSMHVSMMFKALTHHHWRIIKTSKSEDQFHILQFCGYEWPEEGNLFWNQEIFKRNFKISDDAE